VTIIEPRAVMSMFPADPVEKVEVLTVAPFSRVKSFVIKFIVPPFPLAKGCRRY
jgi:hypothetical protein